jgi:hypothetical protein
MSSRPAATLFALIVFCGYLNCRAQQRLLTVEQTQVLETVSTRFTARRTDDVAKFKSVMETEFYIFDGQPNSA